MHWIEEAEQHKSKRESSREMIHERIVQKKDDVNKNWDINKTDYLALISKLEEYINRINNLPVEFRHEFGHIGIKEKKSSLQNHLIKCSSSRRKIIKGYNGLFAPFKAKHFKNTRNVFFSLSRQTDYVWIETKEITAPRIRLNEEPENIIQWFRRFFKRKEKSIVKRAKNKIKISDLNDNFVLYFIDFMTFRNEGNEYFFINAKSQKV